MNPIKTDLGVLLLRIDAILRRAAMNNGLAGDDLNRMVNVLADNLAWVDQSLTKGGIHEQRDGLKMLLEELSPMVYTTKDRTMQIRLAFSQPSVQIQTT